MMSWIWTGFTVVSVLCAVLCGRGSELSRAILEGAQSGITLGIAMAGSICLWSGIGALMERLGLSRSLSRLLMPLLTHLFPESRNQPELAGYLSGNLCANLLGLGNAATPMGIHAAKQLRNPRMPDLATDSLCRLVVLNTASIQLIPANVAAIRMSLGCATPFDILCPVWITSFSSAGLGLAAAWLLGKLWKYD